MKSQLTIFINNEWVEKIDLQEGNIRVEIDNQKIYESEELNMGKKKKSK